ncbi:MAG: hypothetical protein N2544_15175 [Burkholderiales bacterium]|nr:hypothetical protein [Burkholderiales bacterium]
MRIIVVVLSMAGAGCAGQNRCGARKVVRRQEEVELSSGRLIVIERGDRRRPAVEPGTRGSNGLFDEAWLVAELPGVGVVRSAGSLAPLVLDVSPEGRRFLPGVVRTYPGREDRAVPAGERYVAFEPSGKGWQRTPLVQFPETFKPSLVANAHRLLLAEEHAGGGLATLTTKRRVDSVPTRDAALPRIDRRLGQCGRADKDARAG